MNTQPANSYFDRACESHAQFLQIKKELEGKGFKHDGNYSTHERDYEAYIRERDEVFSEEHPFPPDLGWVQTLHTVREKHNFRNLVEERTLVLRHVRSEVVRTRAFDDKGNELEGSVAFFAKLKKQN